METAVIRVSSKGQVVIPAEWRKRIGVDEGDELLAISEGDVLLLKRVEKSLIRKEFFDTVKPIRRKIRRLGIQKKDLENAIKKARKSS
jgi:AbrB family looped-hinge helix DNA binding protein